MADQPSNHDHDPVIAAKLAARYERMRAVTGPEPADLGAIARWVDGDASPEETKAIEARVAGDAELGEVVARMRSADNVASLAEARAARERVQARTRGLWLGGGVLLAAAAAALVVVAGAGTNPTGPTGPTGQGVLGAGPDGARPRVAIVDGRVHAEGASLLVVLGPGAARVAANGDAAAHEACSFVLAIAGAVDAARATETLRDVVSDACELPPLDVIKARLEGATALTLTRP